MRNWARCLGIVAGLLPGLYGGALWRASTLKPLAPRDVSRELAESAKRSAPPGARDGWPHLAATIARGKQGASTTREGSLGLDFSQVINAQFAQDLAGPAWSSGAGPSHGAARVVSALEQAGFFEALDELAASDVILRPAEELRDRLLTDRATFDIARLLASEIRHAAHWGDEGRLALRTREALGMIRLLESEPNTMSQLVGQALRGLFVTEIARVASEYRLGEGVLRAVLAEVESIGPPDPSMRFRALKIESAPWFDRCFTKDGVLVADATEKMLGPLLAVTTHDPELATLDLPSPPLAPRLLPGLSNFRGYFYCRRDENDRIVAEFLDLCDASTPSRPGAVDPSREFLTRERTERVPGLLAMVLSTSMRGKTGWRMRFEHEAARLVLAIAIYESVHTLAPESLTDLTAEYVEPFPADPWNGATWHYRLYAIKDRPSRWQRYQLFGLGPDRLNNGGAGDDMPAVAPRQPLDRGEGINPSQIFLPAP